MVKKQRRNKVRKVKKNKKLQKNKDNKDKEIKKIDNETDDDKSYYEKSKLFKIFQKYKNNKDMAVKDDNINRNENKNDNENEIIIDNNSGDDRKKLNEEDENDDKNDEISSYLPMSDVIKKRKNKTLYEDEFTEVVYGTKLYEFLNNNKKIQNKFLFKDYNAFINNAHRYNLENKKSTDINLTFLFLNLLIDNIEEDKTKWVLYPISFENYFNLHFYKENLKKYVNIYKYKQRYKKRIEEKKEKLKRLFGRMGFYASKIKEDYQKLFWHLYTLPNDIKIIFYTIVQMKHETHNHKNTMWLVYSLLNSYIGNILRFGRENYLDNCIIYNV